MDNNCKKDEALLEVIDKALEENASKVDALKAVIAYKRANRGLVGMHISDYDSWRGWKSDAERIAADILQMEKACAEGKGKSNDVMECI